MNERTRRPRSQRIRVGFVVAALLALTAAAPALAMPVKTAVPSAAISGSGSSWAKNAVEDWKAAAKGQGITVNYNDGGSSQGRKDFANGLADFAVSEIPYTGDTADPQDNVKPSFGYAMLPVVAGGTAFMYHLYVGGKRFDGLKLDQLTLAKIFSGGIQMWNDPAIKATNPGIALPAQKITVVVRADGSGATAQFTQWMLRQFPAQYKALCDTTGGCKPGRATSYFPTKNLEVGGPKGTQFVPQSKSDGVTTYTASTQYTINYDEYSYAQNLGFPSAQIKNAAGFYTLPTEHAVAVALTRAKINNDKRSANYLSQDLTAVYPYKDPRSYPLSAYSYMIEPTQTRGNFNKAKGATLAYFEQFVLCEGQRTMGQLGYSPLPMNLVLAALDQVLKVPGIGADTKAKIAATKAGVKSGGANPCNNPTFKPGDSPNNNQLIKSAPFPAGCDAACQAPWINAIGTGGPGKTPAAPTGTGTGTGTDTGAVPGAGAGAVPTATPGAATNCDPVTGLCTGDQGAAAGSGDPNASANPYNLTGQKTWGTAQLALLISVLLLAVLVLGPPLAARALDSGRTPPRAAAAPPVTAEPPVPPAPGAP
ncbi:substrate-binding domain-containing protein [Nocardioides sp. WS12]|uniref:substrate-binding domain-containing protein n=1 Tax=Nocardioides sp. WS12 TaxID=2486272 RepID=UPI0015F7FFA3|nr:substrate-binding domain-containing protein [Nocardioides sp. WS12]